MKSSVWKSPPNCSLSLANAAASDSSIDRCADSGVVLMPSGRHAAIFSVSPIPASSAAAGLEEAASHADPRTTMRYDRARASLDRHATYIVAAYVAGAAR
jgi:hypothetical protein